MPQLREVKSERVVRALQRPLDEPRRNAIIANGKNVYAKKCESLQFAGF